MYFLIPVGSITFVIPKVFLQKLIAWVPSKNFSHRAVQIQTDYFREYILDIRASIKLSRITTATSSLALDFPFNLTKL